MTRMNTNKVGQRVPPVSEFCAAAKRIAEDWLVALFSPTSEKKQNDQNQTLTKIILRSFGYGLSRKPLIFLARYTTDRARAQPGAAWHTCVTGA